MKKLLLTAFTPFDGERINPALEAVKLVKDKIGNLEIVKLEVPTVFGKSIETVREAIEREKPDFVLSIGQAGGRAEITPERVAINLDDARIPDNEGNQPIDEPIFPDGENAYFSTLPVKAMVEAIRKEGLPSSLSNSAGTYVCNHLMYGVLYFIHNEYCSHSVQYLIDKTDKKYREKQYTKVKDGDSYFSASRYSSDNNVQHKPSNLLFSEEESSSVVKAGFIHVPYIPEQVKDKKEMPALPLSDIVRGLEVAIRAVEEHESDLKKTFGSEC